MCLDRALQRLWLYVPPVLLFLLDGCLTLLGQPTAYWGGDFSTVNEGNPLAAWLLTVHPLAFAAAGVPYTLLVAGAILWLPWRWAEIAAVLVSLSHMFGVISWSGLLASESFGASLLFIPISVALLAVAWRRCGRRLGPVPVRGRTMSDHTARGRPGSRLFGVAVLVTLAYPLSLGPACWTLSWLQLEMRHPEVADAVSLVYSPLAPAVIYGPQPVCRAMKWWIGVGMPARTEFQYDRPGGVGWNNPGYNYTLWQY